MHNQQILTQRKVYGIYEKTQAMTEEQISEAICERFKGISTKEYDALVNNKELRKHDYSVNRDVLDVALKGIEGLEQFIKGVNLEKFIEWLVSHGEERIYEINTCEVDAVSYIMDTTALVIKSKLEAYWCSDIMDWALIKDHEGFIFVCGKWLVEVLKSEDATSQLHL